jgi:hypothetical protein
VKDAILDAIAKLECEKQNGNFRNGSRKVETKNSLLSPVSVDLTVSKGHDANGV